MAASVRVGASQGLSLPIAQVPILALSVQVMPQSKKGKEKAPAADRPSARTLCAARTLFSTTELSAALCELHDEF